jgi:hypothetical protein
VREGPEFVIWFIKLGTAVVVTVVAISILLFWLLKRWSDRQAAAHDKTRKASADAARQR